MPYNPGIQDISGQLLAQGMQARAQGIGAGVTTLFQGLQQNQMMTNQAIARFQAASAANPKLLDFLNKAGTEESPVPVNPDVLKAYADIKSGKTNVQNTALLAQFADSYNQAEMAQQQQMLRQAQMASMASENQLREAQRKKILAELEGGGGTIMTMDEFRKMPSDVDARAEPVPGRSGMVRLLGVNLRAPASQELKPVDLGGEVGFVNAQGVIVRREKKSAQAPVGFEYVGAEPSTPAPAETTAGAAPATAAAPGQPIAGPAILGRFMPPSATRAVPKEALEAMQPAAAPKPEAGTRVLRPTPGGPVDIEQKAKAAAEQAARGKKIETLSQIDSTIDTLLKRVNEYSVGPGAAVRKLPIAGKGTDAAEIEALLPQLRAQLAFDALKDLKASNTSLGQVAIKEIELLQSAIVALDQDAMKPETFRSQLLELKNRIQATGQRLLVLDQEYRAGRTEPSEAYYKLGGRPLDELNKAAAAPSAVDDPMKALEAAGFRRTKK